MAQPLPCDLCGNPVGTFVITAQQTGDTLGVCAECVPAWAEAITAALDGATSDRHEPPTAPQGALEVADAEWEYDGGEGPPRPPEAPSGGAEGIQVASGGATAATDDD